MLVEASTAIESRLAGNIPALRTVDVWEGEVEELLKKPHLMPSAHVIYGGCQYGELVNLGGTIVAAVQTWSVILLGKNLKSRKDGAQGIYPLIEEIRAALTKFDTGYGYLMPAAENLIVAQGGLLGYGLDFTLETETEET